MCKAASFMVTKDKVYWSQTSDSHDDIIRGFKLHIDGVRGANAVPVEISPPEDNLSLPLQQWKFRVDGGMSDQYPEWWDKADAERRTRVALTEWKKAKLGLLRLKEAFNPVNPLKITRDKTLPVQQLLADWDSVRASVGDSVWASVWASVGASVRASVWASVGASVWASVRDSVRASVGDSVWASVWASVGASVRASVWASVGDSVWASAGDSVWAYVGSLWHGIKKWEYTDRKNPWASLRKLWLGGYVPSFDGKTWRLHAGVKADVVFEISKEDLRK